MASSCRDLATALVLGAAIALLCMVSGPVTFDCMDGAEFAVAGQRLEIPHSPGYPLLMWLLRLSGERDYNSLRLFGCAISGLAACGVYYAIRSFRIGPTASAAASLMLMSSGAVMSQLNILEVHGLSLLLASLAIASRESRLGPYAMSMAVFGGHPLSAFLLPMVVGKRWLRTWPLALIPATMWLYVPLRSDSAVVMHYGLPRGVIDFSQYMTMYGGRISELSFAGLWNMLLSMGAITAAGFLLASSVGRFDKRILVSLAGVLLVFLFYGVPDLEAYSWLLLLPLSVAAASGIRRLLDKGHLLICLSMLCLIAASAVHGTLLSWNRRGDAMHTITSDMIRGIPHDRILCTTDAASYYCAYLLEAEDRRPDLHAVDRFGLVHSLSLLIGPLRTVPSEIAGHCVYATGAWGILPPSGLLFSVENRRLAWDEYDVFSMGVRPAEQMACDAMAELWSLRALQENGHAETMAAFGKALEYAESEGAVSAVNSIINRYTEAL